MKYLLDRPFTAIRGVPVTVIASLNVTETSIASPTAYLLSLPADDVTATEVIVAFVSTTVTVLVETVLRLFEASPSLACHEIVLVVDTDVGLFEVLRNVTARNAFWYCVGVPVPVSVRTPVEELYVPLIEPIVDPSFVKASTSPVVSPAVIDTVPAVKEAVSASVTSMPVRTTPAAEPSVYVSCPPAVAGSRISATWR